MVDRVSLFSKLSHDAAVTVTAPVLRMYSPDSATLVGISVPALFKVVVICGTGQATRLQEMFKSVLGAQFADDLGPIPNISAFSSWSRAFNFFK